LTGRHDESAIDAEPVTADELRDVAARLAVMEARLALAEQALASEKAGHGLLARFQDLFIETNAEAAVDNARATVEKLKGLAANRVSLWLRQRPAILAKDAEGADGPVGRYLDLAERHRKLARWQALAEEAVTTMEHGARRYANAATMELADAMLRSPQLSIASMGALPARGRPFRMRRRRLPGCGLPCLPMVSRSSSTASTTASIPSSICCPGRASPFSPGAI
jgi:hypothetical protein